MTNGKAKSSDAAPNRESLATMLDDLRKLRDLAAETQANISDHQAQFNAQNAELFKTAQLFREAVIDLDAKVRALALAIYKADPSSKQVAPGVSVRDVVEVEITDPKAVREWCLAQGLFLEVDQKAFKSYIKGEHGAGRVFPAGARIVTGQQATIAREIPAQKLPAPVADCSKTHP